VYKLSILSVADIVIKIVVLVLGEHRMKSSVKTNKSILGILVLSLATSSATSNVAAADAAPAIGSATISGSVKVGQTLTATANSVTGSPTPTPSYEWKVSGSNTVVSTTSTYSVASGDLGKTITVKITVANGVGSSASATSRATSNVAAAPAFEIDGLSLSSGTLSPAFSPSVTSYSATVSNKTLYVNVRPIFSAAGLGFRVNGNNNVASGAASQLVLLASGPNTITIWSTARTGERKVITITVNRLAPGTYQLGDTGPGGGTIFYVAPEGTYFTEQGAPCGTTCRYLEAAPTSGTRAWVDSTYAWSGNVATAIGTTRTSIGTGYSNTLAIVAQSGGGNAVNKAATVTRAYRGPNNLTDWFLPSKDELKALYDNRAYVPGAPGNYIWSSSEASATSAWRQYFYADTQETDGKQYTGGAAVRPIRAF
jgi:large repetitive protein